MIELIDHQKIHFNRLIHILENEKAFLDTSDMGSGKTYTTVKLAEYFNLSLLVICPLSVISVWEKLSKQNNVPIVKLMTYASLRGTKKSPPKHNFLSLKDDKYEATDKFREYIKKGILLVFDELHYLKNQTAQLRSAQALIKEIAKQDTPSRIGLLSATPIDKEEHTVSLVKLLALTTQDNLIEFDQRKHRYVQVGIKEVLDKCRSLDEETTLSTMKNQIIDKHSINSICLKLYNSILRYHFASGMETVNNVEDDIKNGFYYMSSEDLSLLQEGIEILTNATRFRYDKDTIVGDISWNEVYRASAKIEKSKLNIIIRKTFELLNENPKRKILIFLNYIHNMKFLQEKLEKFNPLILYGQTKNREEIINKIQTPSIEHRVLISNPKVGGVGISLDDQTGEFPRFVFIIPSYYFIDLYQATGRVNRSKTRSSSTIRFVFGQEKEIEKRILDALARKAKITRSSLYQDKKYKFPGEFPDYIEPLPSNST